MTEFMEQLEKELREEKKLAAITARTYVHHLLTANGKKNFSSLKFLTKTDDVLARLENMKFNTSKAILTAISSVLKFKKQNDLYKVYEDKLMTLKKPDANELTETQAENWINWNEIKEIHESLHEKLQRPHSWEDAMKYLLVSLYTQIQPRRNLDYLHMYVVKKCPEKLDESKNYLCLDDNTFIFNNYKTAKVYGTQTIKIPKDLRKSLDEVLPNHPLASDPEYPLLTNDLGDRWKTSGAITHFMNRIFNKKVGASMLRHIYLSDKMDINEMKEDSNNMAHSLTQQREYLKNKK